MGRNETKYYFRVGQRSEISKNASSTVSKTLGCETFQIKKISKLLVGFPTKIRTMKQYGKISRVVPQREWLETLLRLQVETINQVLLRLESENDIQEVSLIQFFIRYVKQFQVSKICKSLTKILPKI